MIRIMGIAGDTIVKWHPQDTYEPYGDSHICYLQVGSVRRWVVKSKYSHFFTKKHFGADIIVGDYNATCKSGIVFEERTSVAYEYVDMRIYMQDVLKGYSTSVDYPYERFSEVSMALLMDTGFYEVDWRAGKPLTWGHKDTNGGVLTGGKFISGPPQLSMPKHYINENPYYYYSVGFDYSYVGRFRTGAPPGFGEDFKGWYNPKAYCQLDFQPIPLPHHKCPGGMAAMNCVNANAQCFPFECSDDGKSYTYTTVEGTGTCTREGQTFEGTTPDGVAEKATYVCNDPEDFCRRISTWKMDHFESDPFAGIDDEEETTPEPQSDKTSEMTQTHEEKTEHTSNSDSVSSSQAEKTGDENPTGNESGEENHQEQSEEFSKSTGGIILWSVLAAVGVLLVVLDIVIIQKKKSIYTRVDDDNIEA